MLSRLSILACMPQAQQIEGGALYLVTHLVVADDNSADIPWLKLFKPFANAWISQQCGWSSRELLNRMRGSRLVHRGQKLVQPGNVGKRLACPLQLHQRGTGSGESVLRLSAQAWTAW